MSENTLATRSPTRQDTTMSTTELTLDTFESTVTADGITFVDFWAEWCGPCKMFGPIFEETASENPDVTFAKVNTEAEQQLAEAANYLNHHGRDRSLADARRTIETRQEALRSEVDAVSADLIARGLAVWSGSGQGQPAQLIVRGRSNLIENVQDKEQIERLKLLFDELERKDEIVRMLDLTETGSGVKIFIGSENRLFSLSGSSLVVAPYRDAESRVVGALGVIGPTRLNYARIVPVVDYTAQVISRMIR
mgnify:CR=1 FL=1